MGIIPTRVQDQLDFFDQHQGVWSGNAAQIGISSSQATAFKTAAGAARAAYTAQLDAAAARLVATNAASNARSQARQMCADLISLIKGFANNQPNPDHVYDLAQIPPPASATTAPPPGTPSDFVVELLQNGTVKLKWKCQNPPGTSGTIYEVRRRAGQTAGSPFVFIGATGVREFEDDTLPAGGGPGGGVTYEITAVRSTSRGNPATWNVTFGHASGGGLTVQALQMAA